VALEENHVLPAIYLYPRIHIIRIIQRYFVGSRAGLRCVIVLAQKWMAKEPRPSEVHANEY